MVRLMFFTFTLISQSFSMPLSQTLSMYSADSGSEELLPLLHTLISQLAESTAQKPSSSPPVATSGTVPQGPGPAVTQVPVTLFLVPDPNSALNPTQVALTPSIYPLVPYSLPPGLSPPTVLAPNVKPDISAYPPQTGLSPAPVLIPISLPPGGSLPPQGQIPQIPSVVFPHSGPPQMQGLPPFLPLTLGSSPYGFPSPSSPLSRLPVVLQPQEPQASQGDDRTVTYVPSFVVPQHSNPAQGFPYQGLQMPSVMYQGSNMEMNQPAEPTNQDTEVDPQQQSVWPDTEEPDPREPLEEVNDNENPAEEPAAFHTEE